MDSFEGIVEFVAVAECQGFSAAAKQLGCSSSHVSRQIVRLEKRLGCSLFARSTRSVSLTQSGEVYYRQCKDLVVGLQQANEEVTQQQVQLSGTLRVSGAGAFAEQFVAPALIEFAINHPDLTIDMDFNSRMVNFIEEGIDFSIRYGVLSDSGLVARRLLDRSMMAVASPEYLQKNGMPDLPSDLKEHSCIISNNEHWHFQHKGSDESIRVQGRWRSNNSAALVHACERGLGIAYLPKNNFTASVEKGLLIPVLEPYWSHGVSSWIVYQRRQFMPMRTRMAIDYLVNYFQDWPDD